MDNKKVLIFVIFTLVGIVELSETARSCHLECGNFYEDPYCVYEIYLCDWQWDLWDGCEMGFAAGPFFGLECRDGVCVCELKSEAKWKKTGTNGEICKLRWGADCGRHGFGGWFEGRYDASTGTCVKCIGHTAREQWRCEGGEGKKTNVYKCESACGAHYCCDELTPNSYVFSSSCFGYCNSSCNFIEWKVNISSNATTVNSNESVLITVYSNFPADASSQRYLEIVENGNVVKTCGEGNTCSYVAQKTYGSFTYYGRVRVKISNTYVTKSSNSIVVKWKCVKDSDCPGPYGCNSSSGICYTSCNSDSHCKSGYYCYCGVCSNAWTNSRCDASCCCNKGFGGTEGGECVDAGTIYTTGDVSYICWWQSSGEGGGGGGPWE